jgi:small conductance mechanosensitive channel
MNRQGIGATVLVWLKALLDHRFDVFRASQLLKQQIAAIPNVTSDPAPVVEVLHFNPPVVTARPLCDNACYWQVYPVYFDTNRVIREAFTTRGFPAAVAALVFPNHCCSRTSRWSLAGFQLSQQ